MPLPDTQGAPIECDAKCTIYHKGAGKDHHPLNGSIAKGSRTYPGQQAVEPSAYREDGTTLNTDWTDRRAPELMNMDLGAISARINAPNDGRNASGQVVVAPTLALTSKLNSDATGMRYQWGRKDPFTYATSSEKWGGDYQYGKYPVKIYTIDGVLIYQVENGTTNNGKSPLGGVIVQSSPASSMLDAIANPITFYHGSGTVINQTEHSGDLYNYYWTSYSRGTDGRSNPINPNWHNAYLDGYIPLRVKSIYDPCPYLYRIPSNGTWNQFNMKSGWTTNSYLAGVSWNINTLSESWFLGLGYRAHELSNFGLTGHIGYYYSSTVASQSIVYALGIYADKQIWLNRTYDVRSFGFTVRCIEDCDPRADGTPAAATEYLKII